MILRLGQPVVRSTETSSAETNAEETLPFSQTIDAYTGASPVQALPKIDLLRDETPNGGLRQVGDRHLADSRTSLEDMLTCTQLAFGLH
jgi:hypothetical protein